MRKPKQPKTTDPVKLAQMRERMAKARAARDAKRKPLEEAAEENGGPILPPPVESDPSPAAPSGEPDMIVCHSTSTHLDDDSPAESTTKVLAKADDPEKFNAALKELYSAPFGHPDEPPPETAPATEWPSYMPVAHGEREFQVIQMPQNPRLVICRDPGQPDQRFHVDVGNNENFALGMTLKAIPKPAPENAFWKLMGPLPRYKGRY